MPVQFAHTYDKILAAVNSGKRIIICRGGTSAAKTFSVLQYLVIRSLKYQEKTDIVAETIPALKKGVLSDLTNGGIAENLGIKWADLYNITSMIATMPSGGSLNFVAFENELQARGARRKNLFLNEANRIKWEVAEQLIMRTDGLIFIDFNPTAGFWVVDEFLQNPKYADQVCELVLTYKDNQHLAQSIVSFIESKRSNAAWWRVYGLGEWGVSESHVFGKIGVSSGFPMDGADMYIDPAFVGGRGNDYTAVSIGSVDGFNQMHVVGFAWQESWHGLHEQGIYRELIQKYNVRRIVIENNAIGDMPYHFFRDYNLPIECITHSGAKQNKHDRICRSGVFSEAIKLVEIEDKANEIYNREVRNYSELSVIKDPADSLSGLCCAVFPMCFT